MVCKSSGKLYLNLSPNFQKETIPAYSSLSLCLKQLLQETTKRESHFFCGLLNYVNFLINPYFLIFFFFFLKISTYIKPNHIPAL